MNEGRKVLGKRQRNKRGRHNNRCTGGLPSSFKGINRKRDDILRWVSLSDCAERFRNRSAKFRNRSAKSLSETQRKMSTPSLLIPLKGLIGKASTFFAEFCWAISKFRWAISKSLSKISKSLSEIAQRGLIQLRVYPTNFWKNPQNYCE